MSTIWLWLLTLDGPRLKLRYNTSFYVLAKERHHDELLSALGSDIGSIFTEERRNG